MCNQLLFWIVHQQMNYIPYGYDQFEEHKINIPFPNLQFSMNLHTPEVSQFTIVYESPYT